MNAAEILEVMDAKIAMGRRDHNVGLSFFARYGRENFANMFAHMDIWPEPAAMNVRHSEIHVVWRSVYGKVEVDTNDDGFLEYDVLRTMCDRDREAGTVQVANREQVEQIFSWLSEKPLDIVP